MKPVVKRLKTLVQKAFVCPVCHEYWGEGLGKHIQEAHGKEAFQKAVISAKESGLSDALIGEIFGITFRQLERIVTETYGLNVSCLKRPKRITCWEPKEFREETTTVWSFPKRGNWATHHGGYRGNWSPYIPRNVILKYSKPGDTVLDYFVGGGTTAVEAKLLGRRCIARDINPACIEMTKKHLDFSPPETLFEKSLFFEPVVSVGDARDLSDIEDNSIDLICAHPPYAGIISYSTKIEGDLSSLDVEDFLEEMRKVARESFRVLKPGGKCAILIGDTRRRKHVVPIGFALIGIFLEEGFRLKELIIKRQHNCKTTGFWREKSVSHNFLLLAHEYLPIFEKPSIEVSFNLRKLLSKPVWGVRVLDRVPLSDIDLETTSVWIFPKDAYDVCLNNNVVRRYALGRSYRFLYIEPGFGGETSIREPLGLLFIRSPIALEVGKREIVNSYLEFLEKLVERNLINISSGGFLVIDAQDIRINGYIEPLGKYILDRLPKEKLWLKEIVIVTEEKNAYPLKSDCHDLEIVHRYLFVYEF